MQRAVLNISYIGSLFRGVTKIDTYYKYGDASMVQGCLEKASKSVLGERCKLQCASRTDAKVHGTSTYFQLDYNHPKIDTLQLLRDLNVKLAQMKAAIRVNSVELVDPNRFEAYRNVFSRSYLYRLAVMNPSKENNRLVSDDSNIPIEEVDRCYFIKSRQFDIERFRWAAALVVGKHDFRTFMEWSREVKTQSPTYAWRHMLSVSVENGRPAFNSFCKDRENCFQFYDVHFTARSYVYRQIRRLIGAMCSVAQHRISERDFYEMLTIPSHKTWDQMERNKLVRTAPACGLYLNNITYKGIDEWDLSKVLENPRGIRIISFLEEHVHSDERWPKCN